MREGNNMGIMTTLKKPTLERTPALPRVCRDSRQRPHASSLVPPPPICLAAGGPGCQSSANPPLRHGLTRPGPAILSQETWEAAQARLERHTPCARRNPTAHSYRRRGLVSWGQGAWA